MTHDFDPRDGTASLARLTLPSMCMKSLVRNVDDLAKHGPLSKLAHIWSSFAAESRTNEKDIGCLRSLNGIGCIASPRRKMLRQEIDEP